MVVCQSLYPRLAWWLLCHSRALHRLVGVTGCSQEVFCHASVPSPCYKNASHHWDGISWSGTDERGEPITCVSDWCLEFYGPNSGSARGLEGYTMGSSGSTLGAWQLHGVIQMSVTWGTSSLIRHEPYWFQVTASSISVGTINIHERYRMPP